MKSRIFNPRHVAAIEQCERADQQRLLRSGRDDDLIGMTMRAAEVAEISGNRFAQVGIAAT